MRSKNEQTLYLVWERQTAGIKPAFCFSPGNTLCSDQKDSSAISRITSQQERDSFLPHTSLSVCHCTEQTLRSLWSSLCPSRLLSPWLLCGEMTFELQVTLHVVDWKPIYSKKTNDTSLVIWIMKLPIKIKIQNDFVLFSLSKTLNIWILNVLHKLYSLCGESLSFVFRPECERKGQLKFKCLGSYKNAYFRTTMGQNKCFTRVVFDLEAISPDQWLKDLSKNNSTLMKLSLFSEWKCGKSWKFFQGTPVSDLIMSLIMQWPTRNRLAKVQPNEHHIFNFMVLFNKGHVNMKAPSCWCITSLWLFEI